MGAWPDAQVAERTVESLGVRTPWLDRLATDLTAVIDRSRLVDAFQAANRFLKRGLPGEAGFFLAPLLPVLKRLGDPELGADLHKAVLEFLVHPLLAPEERDGFAKHCERLLDAGAWGARELGENVIEDLGIGAPGLDSLVADSSRKVNLHDLRRSLQRATELLSGPRPLSARHILLASVPLSARVEDPSVEVDVLATVRRLLEHPEATQRFRDGFARDLQGHLESGAWSDPERGRMALEGLGLLSD